MVVEWNGTMSLPAQGSGPEHAAAFSGFLKQFKLYHQRGEGFLLLLLRDLVLPLGKHLKLNSLLQLFNRLPLSIGVTFTVAEGGPTPMALAAVTEQV